MMKTLKADGLKKFLKYTDPSVTERADVENHVSDLALSCNQSSSSARPDKSRTQSVNVRSNRASTLRLRSTTKMNESKTPMISEERTSNRLGIKGGRITHEQKLAERAKKEKKSNKNVLFVTPSPRSSDVDSSDPNNNGPTSKLNADLTVTKTFKSPPAHEFWDSQDFQKKMDSLDIRAQKMKKGLSVERRPHQQVPAVKPMSAHLKKNVKLVKIVADKSKYRNAKRNDSMFDKAKPSTPSDPNFIEISSLSTDPWQEICGITSGINVLILMKTMPPRVWDSLRRYYGIFERLGRLDRAILFEIAQTACDKINEQPNYQSMMKNLHFDMDEALFQLGKLMMSVYRGIVTADGSLPSRGLSLPEIISRLDEGHKAVTKMLKNTNDKNKKGILKTPKSK